MLSHYSGAVLVWLSINPILPGNAGLDKTLHVFILWFQTMPPSSVCALVLPSEGGGASILSPLVPSPAPMPASSPCTAPPPAPSPQPLGGPGAACCPFSPMAVLLLYCRPLWFLTWITAADPDWCFHLQARRHSPLPESTSPNPYFIICLLNLNSPMCPCCLQDQVHPLSWGTQAFTVTSPATPASSPAPSASMLLPPDHHAYPRGSDVVLS